MTKKKTALVLTSGAKVQNVIDLRINQSDLAEIYIQEKLDEAEKEVENELVFYDNLVKALQSYKESINKVLENKFISENKEIKAFLDYGKKMNLHKSDSISFTPSNTKSTDLKLMYTNNNFNAIDKKALWPLESTYNLDTISFPVKYRFKVRYEEIYKFEIYLEYLYDAEYTQENKNYLISCYKEISEQGLRVAKAWNNRANIIKDSKNMRVKMMKEILRQTPEGTALLESLKKSMSKTK